MAFIPGAQVGPYQILEQLGQGGMATVYKAYHPALDRYVALKALHPAFMEDPNFLERFQREARVVARLDHPNIVPVYDFSEHEGRPYLVMKFVEGETLKARLQRGPLSPDEIGRIAEAVGAALTYAHEQGVLHRDVKPSNVLLSTDGRIYLTDFGLARIAQAGESTLSSDRLLGTPQYISPEQALGKSDLDARTDIYAFGVMLYEMLLGRVPYNADTPYAIIHDHIYAPLPRPRDIDPNLPPALERVLLKALAKQPEDRFADVPAMMDALQKALAEATGFQTAPAAPPRGLVTTLNNALPTREIEPPPPATPPEAPPPPEETPAPPPREPAAPPAPRRRRWWPIALGVLALSILAAGALALLNTRKESGEHHRTASATTTAVVQALEVIPPALLRDPALSDALETLKESPQAPLAWLDLATLAWQKDRPAWKVLERGITLARQQGDWEDLADAARRFTRNGYALPAARTALAAYMLAPPDKRTEQEESLRGIIFAAALDKDFPNTIPFKALSAFEPDLAAAAYARYEYLVAGDTQAGDRYFLPLRKARPNLPEVMLLNAERAFFVEHNPRKAINLLEKMLADAKRLPAWALDAARDDETLFKQQQP